MPYAVCIFHAQHYYLVSLLICEMLVSQDYICVSNLKIVMTCVKYLYYVKYLYVFTLHIFPFSAAFPA